MDEELKRRLAECGKSLIDWAQGAGVFVKEQAPLYIQEVLAWEFWNAITFALAAAIVVAFGDFLFRWARKKGVELNALPGYHDAGGYELLICVACVAMVVGTGFFVDSIRHAVKVKVAPRVVLVEKLMTTFNGKAK